MVGNGVVRVAGARALNVCEDDSHMMVPNNGRCTVHHCSSISCDFQREWVRANPTRSVMSPPNHPILYVPPTLRGPPKLNSRIKSGHVELRTGCYTFQVVHTGLLHPKNTSFGSLRDSSIATPRVMSPTASVRRRFNLSENGREMNDLQIEHQNLH